MKTVVVEIHRAWKTRHGAGILPYKLTLFRRSLRLGCTFLCGGQELWMDDELLQICRDVLSSWVCWVKPLKNFLKLTYHIIKLKLSLASSQHKCCCASLQESDCSIALMLGQGFYVNDDMKFELETRCGLTSSWQTTVTVRKELDLMAGESWVYLDICMLVCIDTADTSDSYRNIVYLVQTHAEAALLSKKVLRCKTAESDNQSNFLQVEIQQKHKPTT